MTLYLNTQGVFCVITKEIPEYPSDDPIAYTQLGIMRRVNKLNAYEKRIQSVKQSAVPFQDQDFIAELIFKKGGLTLGEPHKLQEIRPDTFHTIDQEYEIVNGVARIMKDINHTIQ